MTVENELVRSVLIPEIVIILSKYYNLTFSEVMKQFYESHTEVSLADETTGLFGQSPLHLAGLYIMEKDGRIDVEKLPSTDSF